MHKARSAARSASGRFVADYWQPAVIGTTVRAEPRSTQSAMTSSLCPLRPLW